MKLYVVMYKGASGTWYPCAADGWMLVEEEWNLIEWYDNVDKVPENGEHYHILELEV